MPTKRQHLVPQMILKYHATNESKDNEEKLIYQYDKKDHTERCINIKNACVNKNFYELRNNDGSINKYSQNLIEKELSKLETCWGISISKILNEKSITDDEMNMLYGLFAIQLSRMPEIVNYVKLYYQYINPNASEIEQENNAKLSLLALFKDAPVEYNWSLILILNVISNKRMNILKSKKALILNGDRPVLCISPTRKNISRFANFYFPIEKHTCLILSNKKYRRNELFKNEIEFINKQNFRNESRFVYCSESMKEYFCCDR